MKIRFNRILVPGLLILFLITYSVATMKFFLTENRYNVKDSIQ